MALEGLHNVVVVDCIMLTGCFWSCWHKQVAGPAAVVDCLGGAIKNNLEHETSSLVQ